MLLKLRKVDSKLNFVNLKE